MLDRGVARYNCRGCWPVWPGAPAGALGIAEPLGLVSVRFPTPVGAVSAATVSDRSVFGLELAVWFIARVSCQQDVLLVVLRP